MRLLCYEYFDCALSKLRLLYRKNKVWFLSIKMNLIYIPDFNKFLNWILLVFNSVTMLKKYRKNLNLKEMMNKMGCTKNTGFK